MVSFALFAMILWAGYFHIILNKQTTKCTIQNIEPVTSNKGETHWIVRYAYTVGSIQYSGRISVYSYPRDTVLTINYNKNNPRDMFIAEYGFYPIFNYSIVSIIAVLFLYIGIQERNKDKLPLRLPPKKENTLSAASARPVSGRGAKFFRSIGKNLVPKYDELTLFLISVSFLMPLGFDTRLRHTMYHFMSTQYEWLCIPADAIVGLFVAGFAYSIFHVFSSRKITGGEKRAMLYFVVLVSGLSGIVGGYVLMDSSAGFLKIFPLWNVINAVLLLVLYCGGAIDEGCIIDDHPKHIQAVIGAGVVVITSAVCHWMFGMHWAITFSICIAYATNVDHLLQGMFRK
jgi:hypothetical protein